MYKSKMQELFDEMRKYMAGVNDNKDKIFIKMLCDDIHISQKTFGTKYGNMCITSRQTSQGTQRIYTVNTTPYDYDSDSDDDIQRAGGPCFNSDSDSGSDDDIQKACARPRQRSAGPCFNSYLNDDIQGAPASSNLTIVPDDYEVSNDCMQDSPYLTQTAKTVMRSISYVSSSDSEESDIEKSDSEEEEDEMPELLPIDSDDEESNKNDLTISP
jgi:hypothetical protein